jgi:hypothetical protein
LLEVLAKGGEPMSEELTTPGEWLPRQMEAGIWIIGADGDAVALLPKHLSATPANAALVSASKELLALARIIGSAYPNDPGTSDLDDDQPVSITLRDVRRAWAALAKVDQ